VPAATEPIEGSRRYNSSMESDTIVAAITPPGEGGVGIVRASGPLAGNLPLLLFPGLRGEWRTHLMRQGTLVDPGAGHAIDEAIGCLMRAPGSYSGEDVFEIHCHGNPLILERVIALCLAHGCRAARPGEFTLRAFLNGKMDLSQAEAVLDVVRAPTNAGLRLAMQQLSGWLSERIEPMRQELVGTLAHMEAMVDFVEEDIPPQADEATRTALKSAERRVEQLLEGAKQGIVLRDGATLAITGSPNVGKSSIMNALLGLERSIVTPVPGTTRDTVEETLRVRDVPFRTIDTAGITDTNDAVERMGIERSRQAIEGADVVLLVLDRSRPLAPQDELAVRAVERIADSDGRGLVVALNKADLPPCLNASAIRDRLKPKKMVQSSAVQPGGIDELRLALADVALGGPRTEVVVGNVRHQDALLRARTALRAAGEGLDRGTPLDIVSLDVRAAAQALGEITGASVDDELLDRIFREFCIGK
jgi:tRNA modification GTPase